MKRIIVWGSEGAIGQAVLKRFKEEGWQAAALARKATSLSRSADWFYEVDFSDPEEMGRAGKWLQDQVGEIDVILYAAGDIASEKISAADPLRWRQILDNNLTGVFHGLQISLPLLRDSGHIFLLGAVSERLRLPGLSAYAAAKAGVEALAVALSKEERAKKVTVVRPGAVDTPLWEKVPFKKPANAASPTKVAEKIWEAYLAGHKGQLDLI